MVKDDSLDDEILIPQKLEQPIDTTNLSSNIGRISGFSNQYVNIEKECKISYRELTTLTRSEKLK